MNSTAGSKKSKPPQGSASSTSACRERQLAASFCACRGALLLGARIWIAQSKRSKCALCTRSSVTPCCPKTGDLDISSPCEASLCSRPSQYPYSRRIDSRASPTRNSRYNQRRAARRVTWWLVCKGHASGATRPNRWVCAELWDFFSSTLSFPFRYATMCGDSRRCYCCCCCCCAVWRYEFLLPALG